MEDGTVLLTGKNLQGEDKSRVVATGLFIVNVSAGKIIKIVKAAGKVVGKGIKHIGDEAVKVVAKNANKIDDIVKGLKGAKGLIGKDFEVFLHKHLPNAQESFSKKGRDFDGAYDNGKKWFEAKSGNYWKDQIENNARGFDKFKSDMGARLKIATENGVEYELFSNTPIPHSVKEWLKKKGIKYYEILE